MASTPGVRPVFRVARRDAAPLPERLEVLERDGVAGQVQQRVEQHAGVPGAQHEAVAVRPVRMRRGVAQEAGPQDVGHRRGAHRGTRVAGVRLLDGVDRERPDRVDGELVEVGGDGHGGLPSVGCGGRGSAVHCRREVVRRRAILRACRPCERLARAVPRARAGRVAARDAGPRIVVLGDLMLDVVLAPAAAPRERDGRPRPGRPGPGRVGGEHGPLAGAPRARDPA